MIRDPITHNVRNFADTNEIMVLNRSDKHCCAQTFFRLTKQTLEHPSAYSFLMIQSYECILHKTYDEIYKIAHGHNRISRSSFDPGVDSHVGPAAI